MDLYESKMLEIFGRPQTHGCTSLDTMCCCHDRLFFSCVCRGNLSKVCLKRGVVLLICQFQTWDIYMTMFWDCVVYVWQEIKVRSVIKPTSVSPGYDNKRNTLFKWYCWFNPSTIIHGGLYNRSIKELCLNNNGFLQYVLSFFSFCV